MEINEMMNRFPHVEPTFSEEDLRELERARLVPITFDEDCPETTPERAKRFKRVNPKQNQYIAETIHYTGVAGN